MAPIFLFSVTRITHFQVDDGQNRHQNKDNEGQRRGVAEVCLALEGGIVDVVGHGHRRRALEL